MKMNKTIDTIILACSLIVSCMACGGNDPEVEPDPIPTPPEKEDPDKPLGDIILTIGELPDSIKVETSEEFKFSISRENYKGKFRVSLDTICPKFEVIVMEAGSAKQIIRKGCELNVDGKKLNEIDSLTSGEHTIKFSNPAVVGEYELVLGLTGSDGVKKSETIKLKAYSPEVIFKIYEVDPYLELKIFDKNYYEVLNRDYTYDPLSEVFKGKRVDTIYTKEKQNVGYPNSGEYNEHGEQYNIPGRGTTIYLGQEGGKDFWFNSGITFNDQNATLSPMWNNSAHSLTFQKQGFHCLDFWHFNIPENNTYRHRLGKTMYTIECFDFWGKRVTTDLTIVALDRNAILPPTGHRLPD